MTAKEQYKLAYRLARQNHLNRPAMRRNIPNKIVRAARESLAYSRISPDYDLGHFWWWNNSFKRSIGLYQKAKAQWER